MPQAQILLVDDDPSNLQFVTDALAGGGVDLHATTEPKDALASCGTFRYDLVISDVNMPGMTGFQLRESVRLSPGHASVPFLFLSGADPEVEIEIATRLGTDRLIIKPFPRSELRRAVFGLLRILRMDGGTLPLALDRILSDVGDGRETGILTALAGPVVKRIVFQDGRVVFAASNDPRDLIGQALVRSGLISESDLSSAISAGGTLSGTGAQAKGKTPMLAAALTVLRKLAPEQCEQVFLEKVREAMLDVFLWQGGAVEYVAGGVEDSDRPFPISIDLQEIRREGMLRRQRWAEVQRVLPNTDTRFAVVKWPPDFPRTESDKVLARHVESGRSIAEILVELRGQSFAVGTELTRLVKAGALRPAPAAGYSGSTVRDTTSLKIDQMISDEVEASGEHTMELKAVPRTPPPSSDENLPAEKPDTSMMPGPSELPVVTVLTRALVMFREGNLNGARTGLMDVLAVDPANPLARQRLYELDEAIASRARAGGLTDEVNVRLAVPIESLMGRKIPPNDAFVLSRLGGGGSTIADLIGVCPMPEHEVLSAVERYLADGTITRG